MAAEGQVARRLFGIQADTGLEPLAVVVDQTDQHGLHPEGFPRQFHQGVQVVFGGGVDQRHVVQGLLAQGFVGREGQASILDPDHGGDFRYSCRTG